MLKGRVAVDANPCNRSYPYLDLSEELDCKQTEYPATREICGSPERRVTAGINALGLTSFPVSPNVC